MTNKEPATATALIVIILSFFCAASSCSFDSSVCVGVWNGVVGAGIKVGFGVIVGATLGVAIGDGVGVLGAAGQNSVVFVT